MKGNQLWTLAIGIWIVVATALDGSCRSSSSENDFPVDDSDRCAQQPSTPPPHVHYTAFDDASWAITSSNVSSQASQGDQQRIYQEFIQECISRSAACEGSNDFRIYMNANQPSSMVNYTKAGYAKIRAPPELFRLIKEFWEYNRHGRQRVEMSKPSAYHNTWDVPTRIVKTEESHLIAGGWNLSAAIWNAARDILEDWTGQKLAGSSVYGIRVYQNQSILAPHVDRLPLVSSAIINVDQDVDEDWVLEVYGHDGKATNVTMEPGDMVLYESHSVIHGRPFPLKGKFYANIFVHFQPIGEVESIAPLLANNNNKDHTGGASKAQLPPYVIPDSLWSTEYLKSHPKGWTVLTDVEQLTFKGDLYTLRYVAQREPSLITAPHQHCTLLRNAMDQFDVLQFLILEMGYDVNTVCPSNETPLNMAHGKRQVHNFLVQRGAKTYDHLAPALKRNRRGNDRCAVMKAAIRTANVHVVDFVLRGLRFGVNMICSADLPADAPYETPLDCVKRFQLNLVTPEEELFPACKDNHPECAAWARIHECNKNPKYMHFNCAKSCQTCDKVATAAPTPTPSSRSSSIFKHRSSLGDGSDNDALQAVMDHIVEQGGLTYNELDVGSRGDLMETRTLDQCTIVAGAIMHSHPVQALDFLVTDLMFDVNMLCSTSGTDAHTPLDLAYVHFGGGKSTAAAARTADEQQQQQQQEQQPQQQEHPVIAFLLGERAKTRDQL